MLKLSVGGNPLVFHFFRGSRKFGYKGEGGGGVSRFSVESFLSQSAANFRSGTLLCCVSENFR